MSVPDLLTSLAAPLLLSAGAVFAGLEHLVRKYHRPEPNPYTVAQLERLADVMRRQRVVEAAEDIVAAELDRLAPLYDTPTRTHH